MSEQKNTSEREIDDKTKEHIRRFKAGSEEWNKWAREKLEQKKELVASGKWEVYNVVVSFGDNVGKNYTRSSIPETEQWLDECLVDLSDLIFLTNKFSIPRIRENVNKAKRINPQNIEINLDQNIIDFDNFIFPADVDFSRSHFCLFASFNEVKFHGLVNFTNCRFYSKSNFLNVVFSKNTKFDNVKFFEAAFFFEYKFDEFAEFKSVIFENDAFFSNGNFNGFVDFSDAKFKGISNFIETKFNKSSHFTNANFYKKALSTLANFNGFTSFEGACFEAETDFQAIKSTGHFSLSNCHFSYNIPIFTQATFAESPRLDNVKIIPAPKLLSSPFSWQRYFWTKNYLPFLKRLFTRHLFQYPKYIRNKFTNHSRNPDEEAHYRALKRLAIQAHDHENEMKFFAGEIRSRRHITDFANFLTHDFASSMRYWAGVAYELFSDFGRSFIRPVLWWFACLWLFANLTLSNAGLVDKTKCHNSQLTPNQAAYTIGLKNSLLILGLTKTNIVKQAELCLYGLNKNGTNKNGDAENKPKPYNPKIKRTYQTKSTKADTTKTDIPFKAAWQGIIHSGLSLLFIFLLLLAIRNQFKIK